MGVMGTLVIYAMLTKVFSVLCCLWFILAMIGVLSPRGFFGRSKRLFIVCCLCYCCMQSPIIKLPASIMISKLTGGGKKKKKKEDEEDKK
jgi:hypothetical protein